MKEKKKKNNEDKKKGRTRKAIRGSAQKEFPRK
jgi:hypothetical protein